MRRSAAVVTVAVLAVLAAPSTPARSHSADPRVVTVLDAVEPALPPGAAVTVVASIADQVVATNATTAPLDVLDLRGRPFLRISSAGVLADLASPDWYSTNGPAASLPVPKGVDTGPSAPPRWARVTTDPSWGWFDHRLHDANRVLPPRVLNGRQTVLLQRFSVPMTYGGAPLVARGRVEFRPVLGTLSTEVISAPSGLTATVAQGRAPALFVRADPGRKVVVTGSDGQPFAELTAGGARVRAASPTWREDRRSRGLALPVGTATVTVGGGPSLAWMDDRLRYAPGVPPDDVVRASRPTVVGRWEVPVVVDGIAAVVTGRTRWVPVASGASRERGGGTPVLPWALGAGALLVLGAGALVVRRAGRRR